MNNPRVCMLYTDGTNCDRETAFAFSLVGGMPEFVHVNQLRDRSRQLSDYSILVISGGFSYGDDVRAGQILATELVTCMADQLREFVEKDRLVLGICNGFQVLVRTGLLPFNTIGQTPVSLTQNDSGHFECRWIQLTAEGNRCVFTRGMQQANVSGSADEVCRLYRSYGWKISLPVAHMEGKFVANADTISRLERDGLVALRYADVNGIADEYPANPNGSYHGIAGICDATGRILGMMPHPERFVLGPQYPNWRRPGCVAEPHGLTFFRNAVAFFA